MEDLALLVDADARRLKAASEAKLARDVTLPRFESWNYDPCRHHETPQVDCLYRACGGEPLRHQRIGISWLYLVQKGLLADKTGLGKTLEIIGLLALLKQRGELTNRALIVCQTSAVLQWANEFRRFAPGLYVDVAIGTRPQRVQRYVSNFDVMIIGSQMMLRDITMLTKLEIGFLCSDDVDALRNPENQTTRAYNRLARTADRVIQINATPLQIRLEELYSYSLAIGGFSWFGSLRAFQKKYVRQEPVSWFHVNGRKTARMETVGYKNMREFKRILEPRYLRRSYEDVDDVRIPEVSPPEDVWLELHPRQWDRYRELQKGVLVLLREGAKRVTHPEAIARITYGAEICAGLPALGDPDGPGASVKLDWLMHKLTGDWAEEKIVMFSRFKGTIRALRERCKKKNIGIAIIWGDTPGSGAGKARARQAEQDRFWNDPNCRVAVGTSAIERSLNLQNANIVVNFDTLLNPARMLQILGRTRRVGSKFSHVYVFNLFTRDTQEERYLEVLEKRQALADFVWSESSELYDQLSPVELLQMIQP